MSRSVHLPPETPRSCRCGGFFCSGGAFMAHPAILIIAYYPHTVKPQKPHDTGLWRGFLRQEPLSTPCVRGGVGVMARSAYLITPPAQACVTDDPTRREQRHGGTVTARSQSRTVTEPRGRPPSDGELLPLACC